MAHRTPAKLVAVLLTLAGVASIFLFTFALGAWRLPVVTRGAAGRKAVADPGPEAQPGVSWLWAHPRPWWVGTLCALERAMPIAGWDVKDGDDGPRLPKLTPHPYPPIRGFENRGPIPRTKTEIVYRR